MRKFGPKNPNHIEAYYIWYIIQLTLSVVLIQYVGDFKLQSLKFQTTKANQQLKFLP